MNSELRTYLEINCRGHKRGVNARALAREVEISERDLRDLISRAVEEDGLPIGSHPAYGFFWIVDRNDLELATRHLKSRAVSLFRRLAALEKKAPEVLARQMHLWEEEVQSSKCPVQSTSGSR